MFSKESLHLIHEVLVNVSVSSPLAMKFQTIFLTDALHKKSRSILVLQWESLLALLEELLKKSLPCTPRISPQFSLEQLRLGFLSALVILSAQARHLSPLYTEQDTEFLELEKNFQTAWLRTSLKWCLCF